MKGLVFFGLVAFAFSWSIISENVVKLDNTPLFLSYDPSINKFFVGGEGGDVISVSGTSPYQSKKAGKCDGPITGAMKQAVDGKIYFGMKLGKLCVYDTKTGEATTMDMKDQAALEIQYLEISPNKDGILLGMRKKSPESDNWCWLQYFSLPGFQPDWTRFTGRHPGPCKGMEWDKEGDKIFYCDASTRGKWPGIAGAPMREEAMFGAQGYLEACASLGDYSYFLARTGKIEGVVNSNFLAPPDAARSLEIDTGSFEMWKTLTADKENDVLFASSEGGDLLVLKSNPKGLKQVAALKTKIAHRFATSALVVGSLYVAVDSDEDHPSLVILQIDGGCKGGSLLCDCKMNTEKGINECYYGKDVVVESGQTLTLPTNTHLRLGKSLTLSKGANLVMAMSAKIQVEGSITQSGAVLTFDSFPKISEGINSFLVIEGTLDSADFERVKVARSAAVKHFLACFQLARIGVEMKSEGLEIKLSASGLSSCPPLFVSFLIWIVVLAAVGAILWYMFIRQTKEEIVKREQ